MTYDAVRDCLALVIRGDSLARDALNLASAHRQAVLARTYVLENEDDDS